MNIGENQKAVTDRRSGAERRNLLLPNHQLAERRCGTERRTTYDRCFSTDIFNPKRSLFRTIFKNSIKFRLIKKRALKRTPVVNQTGPHEHQRKRAYHRLPCKIPVKILNCETYRFILATARNYSDSGMYLESGYAPAIDSGIAIKMENQSIVSAKPTDIPKYHSRVIWRKELSKNADNSRYGIGIKHCCDLEEFLKLFGH